SPALVLGALVRGPWLAAVALIVSAGVGVSSVGANGGALVSYLAGCVVLGLLLRGTRPSAARAAAGIGVPAAVAFALVGADAACVAWCFSSGSRSCWPAAAAPRSSRPPRRR